MDSKLKQEAISHYTYVIEDLKFLRSQDQFNNERLGNYVSSSQYDLTIDILTQEIKRIKELDDEDSHLL